MKYVRSTDNGRTWRAPSSSPGTSGSSRRRDRAGQHERGLHRTAAARARHRGPAGAGRTSSTRWPAADRRGTCTTATTRTSTTRTSRRATCVPPSTGADLGHRSTTPTQERYLRSPRRRCRAGGPALAGLHPARRRARHRPAVRRVDAVRRDRRAARPAAVWTGSGWRSGEVATGVRVRDMERVDPYLAGLRDAGRARRTASARSRSCAGARPLDRRVRRSRPRGPCSASRSIGDYRDPARILASGASSAREVTSPTATSTSRASRPPDRVPRPPGRRAGLAPAASGPAQLIVILSRLGPPAATADVSRIGWCPG